MLCIAATGCTDRSKQLYDEVMAIHDDAMPKMDNIYRTKQALKKKISGTPDIGEQEKKNIEQVIVSLDSASDAMMDWMHAFTPPDDSIDKDMAIAYLEQEKQNITKVRDRMHDALAKAKKYTTPDP